MSRLSPPTETRHEEPTMNDTMPDSNTNAMNTASNPSTNNRPSMNKKHSRRTRALVVLWLAFCAIAFFSHSTSSRTKTRLPKRNAPVAAVPGASRVAAQPAPPPEAPS